MRRSLYRLATTPDVASLKFDAVIVGGGVAGCLVAGRLGMENLNTLVIEEGSDIRKQRDWYRTLPASLLAHRIAKRGYENTDTITVPQPTLDGAAKAPVWIPTAKVLGGHGVMGTRTWNLGDEQDWEGTPYNFREDLLPRLRAMENMEMFTPHRGKRGKFLICRPLNFSPYFKAFCEGMSQDVPLISEVTRKDFRIEIGCGRPDTFVDQSMGLAHSTLQRYLIDTARLNRPIRVECNSKVVGIRGSAEDKKVATGVSVRRANGEMVDIDAGIVIVCADTIGSAKLLAASRGAIDVPESVGSNFWDIPQVVLQYRTKTPLSHNCYQDALVRLFLRTDLRYAVPLISLRSSWDDLISYWSSTGSRTPDVEILFQPFTLNNDGNCPIPGHHGCQFIIRPMRPKSRGTIGADGSVDPNYFNVASDLAALRKGVEYIKAAVKEKAPFIPVIGELVGERLESSGQNGGSCSTIVNPASSQMGSTANVYVCDNSIIPQPPSGTNLPYTLAFADRFVDKLLKKKNVKDKVDEDADAGATRIVY